MFRQYGIASTVLALALFLLVGWWTFASYSSYGLPRTVDSDVSPPEETKWMNVQWIDPIEEAPGRTSFHLYEQPTRSTASKGSYLIQLPPTYNLSLERRYPLIIWLHGDMSHQRQGAVAFDWYWNLMVSGRIPECILVAPQALPVGWYIDSKWGMYKIASVLTYDLLPHLDREFRTIGTRESRALEGFSMGGYGALHLGLRHPDLFGAVSAVGPSLLTSLDDEPHAWTSEFFKDDQRFYAANAPWTLAAINAEDLQRLGTSVRILHDSKDYRLRKGIGNVLQVLEDAGIKHESWDIAGSDHEPLSIMQGVPEEQFYRFWSEALGGIQT